MKKIFLSAFSLLTSAAMISCAGNMAVFAEEIATEQGTTNIEEEMLISGETDSIKLAMPDIEEAFANYKEGSYNYGNFLDENNLQVYMAFMKLINPSTEQVVVELAEPLTFTTKDDEIDTSQDSDFYNLVFKNCRSGMDFAMYDMPDLFWIDLKNTPVSTGEMTYSYNRFTKAYTYTIDKLIFQPGYRDCFSSLDEVIEYKAKLEDAVENFEVKGTTRYEKLKSIHDQISRFTYYDLDAKFSHNALGALVEAGTVCEGYSKGFKMICDRENIPCVCVYGNGITSDGDGAHMWNYVLMEDNKWYCVDITWDDCDGYYNIEIVYDYFLKGSDNFFKDHVEYPDHSFTHFYYPEVSESDYDPNNVVVVPVTTVTTTKITTTTTKATTTTTAKPTTTTTKTTTITTAKPTTTTTKATTTTTAKPTTTTTKPTTTTTAKPTTTTTKATTTTTAKPTTTTTKATTTEKKTYSQGDVNHDDRVSVADLVYCSNVMLGKADSDYDCDVNGDNTEDVFDLIMLRNIIAEKYWWFLN